jgi:hypothetical protein
MVARLALHNHFGRLPSLKEVEEEGTSEFFRKPVTVSQ